MYVPFQKTWYRFPILSKDSKTEGGVGSCPDHSSALGSSYVPSWDQPISALCEDGKSNQVAYGNNLKVQVKVWAADLAASPEVYLSFIPCGAAVWQGSIGTAVSSLLGVS